MHNKKATRTHDHADIAKIGTRVRLVRDVDRFPDFVAPAGSVGTVAFSDASIVGVKLDDAPAGSESWQGIVEWSDDRRTEYESDVVPADVDAIDSALSSLHASGATYERVGDVFHVFGSDSTCYVVPVGDLHAFATGDRMHRWQVSTVWVLVPADDVAIDSGEGVQVQLSEDIARVADDHLPGSWDVFAIDHVETIDDAIAIVEGMPETESMLSRSVGVVCTDSGNYHECASCAMSSREAVATWTNLRLTGNAWFVGADEPGNHARSCESCGREWSDHVEQVALALSALVGAVERMRADGMDSHAIGDIVSDAAFDAGRSSATAAESLSWAGSAILA